MHTVQHLFVSFLAWLFVGAIAADAPPSLSTSMTLNSTLYVPIDASSNYGIKPQVRVGIFRPNTHRAFYFTYEAQSQMVEVFLPPDGDAVVLRNLTVYDGSIYAQFISSVMQVPSSIPTDPTSPDSFNIYVFSSGGVLLKCSITTPPSSSGVQPSIFTVITILTLPPLLQQVDTSLLVGGYLYLSYVSILFGTLCLYMI